MVMWSRLSLFNIYENHLNKGDFITIFSNNQAVITALSSRAFDDDFLSKALGTT